MSSSFQFPCERDVFIGAFSPDLSLSLSLSLSLVLLFHTKPPGSKRQKNVEFSPKHILLFPDVEKVPLSRTPFARDEASGSFVVSASSRRARRRERRFSFGRVVLSRCPQSDEGNLNRRDSRSIVVVHIRGSLVMSRARVIARGKDAIFLASGMFFPFSTSRALRARARARSPMRAVCARLFQFSL